MKASNRIRIGHALVAGFAFLAITLGNSAAVRADIIATFQSTSTNDYSYTGGATSTLTTVTSPLAGHVSYGATFFPGSNLAATITLTGVHSTSAVTVPVAGIELQLGWSGSYMINEGSHTLTVSFTNATLTVSGGGASLSGDATITANFGNPIVQPESFSISLSGVTPAPTVTGGGVMSNWNASDVNTTSAIVVPEPSTLAIAGLGALGMIGYGIRRRKSA